jgi:RHS repeat-associated protein
VNYVHTDHLGTPRAITNVAAQMVWRWDNSDPFGDNVPIENPSGLGAYHFDIGFPGQYRDRETGIVYNINRYLNTTRGGYNESDLIGLGGGINTYGYVSGNPLSYSDPDGLLGRGIPTRSTQVTKQGIRGTGAANGSVGIGGAIHLPIGVGVGADAGFATDTQGNVCFYSNACYTVGPGISIGGGVVSAIGSGPLSSGTTDYKGACWGGGAGLLGQGSVLFGNDGSAQTGRMVYGPGVGGQATYQACRQILVCVNN